MNQLSREQVKHILELAGWAWDDEKSISGEENRKDCENLVNTAYKFGYETAKKENQNDYSC